MVLGYISALSYTRFTEAPKRESAATARPMSIGLGAGDRVRLTAIVGDPQSPAQGCAVDSDHSAIRRGLAVLPIVLAPVRRHTVVNGNSRRRRCDGLLRDEAHPVAAPTYSGRDGGRDPAMTCSPHVVTHWTARAMAALKLC